MTATEIASTAPKIMNTRLYKTVFRVMSHASLVLKKEFEIFQPDIRAMVKAVPDIILFKGNCNAGHGNIVIYEQINRTRKKHQV